MGRIVNLSLIIILLVLVGSGLASFYAIFIGGKNVEVPSLEGRSVTEALDEIQRLGLLSRVDEIDSSLPKGAVISQWPEAGAEVRKGKVILLKVSKGSKQVSVPDVRNLDYERASQQLREAGFVVGDVLRTRDDRAPAGTVIAQSPAAPALVPENARVSLLVSSGSAGGSASTTTVPDVRGKGEDEARRILRSVGLRVGGVSYVYNAMTAPGIVMEVRPAPGTTIPANGAVSLIVATDRKPQTQEVASSPKPVIPGQAPQAKLDSKEPEPDLAPKPLPEQKKEPQAKPQEQPAKIAKVRYVVPPLSKPLALKMEMVDARGTQTLLDREVKGGEYITLDAPYAKEAVVTIYLGGEFVWQERYF
ncbi:MAG: PASTA domain-containing protein [Synergistales bacterium]|jgi:serine/threonine-protein kinase|nr:PASTA domain-containing protein [Synergistales bacterium]